LIRLQPLERPADPLLDGQGRLRSLLVVPPADVQPPIVVSEAQAVATMEAAGFEVVDVIDTMEDPSAAAGGDPIENESPECFAESCDMMMPHDVRKPAPAGCPPNCPTRLEAEREVQDEHDAERAAYEPELMTAQQRKRMGVEMRRIGLIERDERLAFVARIVGHGVETSNELTVEEASSVITALVAEGLDKVETRYDQDGGGE